MHEVTAKVVKNEKCNNVTTFCTDVFAPRDICRVSKLELQQAKNTVFIIFMQLYFTRMMNLPGALSFVKSMTGEHGPW